LRLVVDAQLPPALARRLEALGHSAEHVADCGLATAADGVIRDHAASTEAAIMTKDEDSRSIGCYMAVLPWCGSGPATRVVLSCSDPSKGI
jgi:predicted nuclease of predicted toxin-antitoxin system